MSTERRGWVGESWSSLCRVVVVVVFLGTRLGQSVVRGSCPAGGLHSCGRCSSFSRQGQFFVVMPHRCSTWRSCSVSSVLSLLRHHRASSLDHECTAVLFRGIRRARKHHSLRLYQRGYATKLDVLLVFPVRWCSSWVSNPSVQCLYPSSEGCCASSWLWY